MKERTDSDRLDYFEDHYRDFRYISTPSMCGRYPGWSYWSYTEGRTEQTVKKTLREALDVAMKDHEDYLRDLEAH